MSDEFLVRRSVQMLKEDPKGAKEAFHEAAKRNDPNPGCTNCGKRHRSLTAEQCIDRQMPEKTLQDRIRGRAKSRGWEIVHIGKAVPAYDQSGAPVWITSAPEGWPDLLLFKPTAEVKVVAMELKREQGEPTEKQLQWLALLNACSIPAMVIRPSDLREGRVNAILDL